MKKNNSITISTASTPHTIAYPAVVTVHLLNQAPGAELVGGVTLYFEPVGTPSIELFTTPNIDARYSNAVAQGIHNSLDASLTGLHIWWCDWLWHPVDSSPRAFTQAAEFATTQIRPWLSPIEFAPDASAIKTEPHFPDTIFEHHPISPHKTLPLQSLKASRWTIKTPLISHVTSVRSTSLFSCDRTIQQRFVETQATLSFKTIASTQQVCPVDKLSEFHPENREILIAFADNIRQQMPNARGFDVLVKELIYKANNVGSKKPKASRQTSCLAILTAALQQAINLFGVGSK